MRKYLIYIAICIFIFIGASFFCDVIYLKYIDFYGLTFGYNEPNPYNVKWNLLWEKFMSFERFLFITTVILYIRKWESFKQYFFISEKNVLFRFIIVYWLYSFADVTDRIIFNIHEFQLNDWVVHLYNIVYILKTIKLCTKK